MGIFVYDRHSKVALRIITVLPQDFFSLSLSTDRCEDGCDRNGYRRPAILIMKKATQISSV